jgi:uncharacterized membrane protein YkvA (DUF1232 family)
MTLRQVADDFPREQFTALVKRMPRYAKLAWSLARDPSLSRARRAAVMAGAAYVVSPIDLVPGFIPVAGQLDDVAVAIVAIRLALNGMPPAARAERLRKAGLTQRDLDADLRTTGSTAVWIGKSGARIGARAASTAAGTVARLLKKVAKPEEIRRG